MWNMEMIWTERPVVKEQSHHSEGVALSIFIGSLKRRGRFSTWSWLGSQGLLKASEKVP